MCDTLPSDPVAVSGCLTQRRYLTKGQGRRCLVRSQDYSLVRVTSLSEGKPIVEMAQIKENTGKTSREQKNCYVDPSPSSLLSFFVPRRPVRVLPATDENGEVHRMVCYPDKLWTEALRLFQTRNVRSSGSPIPAHRNDGGGRGGVK